MPLPTKRSRGWFAAASHQTVGCLAAVALLSLATLIGRAQAVGPTDPSLGAPVTLDKFFVTGTHIPQTETTAEALTFPVLSIDQREIAKRGLTNTAEVLQQLGISNGDSVPISNAGTSLTAGASAVSLRGLGPDATLVLVNGRRLATYPVGAGDGTVAFVDLTSIPLQAVERIDVLKDGASALYGADAIAGVVNIVLKHGLTESVVTSSYGNTTNKDSGRFDAAVFLGRASAEGSLNVGAYYSHRNAIFYHDRSYTAVAQGLSTSSNPGNFQVSRAAVANALGQPVSAPIAGVSDSTQVMVATTGPVDLLTGLPLPGNLDATNQGTLPASAYTFAPRPTSRYNFNEFAGSYPETTRRGTFLTWDRTINSRLTLYGDGFFSRTAEHDELAPYATGPFTAPGLTTIVIPARTPNPILSPPESAAGSRTAAPGAFNPFNPFNQDISGTNSRLRLSEFGNRTVDTLSDAAALTQGARVSGIADRFDLDVSGRYSRLSQSARVRLISTSRFLRILNAADPLFNPASPEYLGTTVPYDPFGYFRNPIPTNSIPVNYATYYARDHNRSDNLDLGATLSTASLCRGPDGPVGFAVGTEFLRDSVVQNPDPAAEAGDVLGTTPRTITRSAREVAAAFAEADIPLVSEHSKPLLHALVLNLAARYENFFTYHDDALVPKVGARWTPLANNALVVRASWGRGYLEPSLYELFSGTNYGFVTVTDPVTNTINTGVSGSSRGNSHLSAETSTSSNVGVVWSPLSLKGFTSAVDFWQIKRNGTPAVSYDETVKRAIAGTLLPGESVVRDADGNIVQVTATYFNWRQRVARGIDFSASYVWVAAHWGTFDFSATATYLESFRSLALPGQAELELVDQPLPGSSGNDAFLRWKGRGQLGWTSGPWAAVLNVHYTAGFADTDASGNPRRVASSTTLDLQGTWLISPRRGAKDHRLLAGLKLVAGSSNVLDRAPPFVSGGGSSTVNYPGNLYDSTGRMVYVSLEKRL